MRAKPVRRCPWFRCPNKKGGKKAPSAAEHFPYCSAECKAAAEKAAKWAAEWPARYERRRAAERLASARHMRDYEERAKFIAACEEGATPLPSKAEMDAEVEAAWKTLRAHPRCHEHFFEYGHAAYRDGEGYCVGKDRCEVCGDTLLCGGEARDHRWSELSGEEARAAGIYHGGSCYHVYRCLTCGEVKSVDSSG